MIAAIIAAVIAALGAVAASLIGADNRRKIDQSQQKLSEIHILVNSRLDSALSQIADLKQQRDRVQGKEDEGDRLRDPGPAGHDAEPADGAAGAAPEAP
jgi:hypothetical protein